MAMDMVHENKVYVAINSNLHDGFLTLQWALKRWSSNSTTIVIIYAANDICKDYVYTPVGKLPASSVNEEKLKDLEKFEEVKTQQILGKYKIFCGNVKVEAIKIERYDESIQKFMVDLISALRITKLVMSLTFMKPSSWKSRTAISGSFFVYRQKPDFCELFIICGGKLVFLREQNNEGFVEDDQGTTVAKSRSSKRQSFRGFVGKMFSENGHKMKNQCDSPSSSATNGSFDQWERYKEEIENYMSQIQSTNSEEIDGVVHNETFQKNITELVMDENMTVQEKIEALRTKIQEIKEAIQLNRQEAKAHVEGQAKAQWAITLCTRRAEELDGCLNDEITRKADLRRETDAIKEEICELHSEAEVTKSKLNSILELQRELSNKLQLSSASRARAEVQLEKAVKARTDTVREIEQFRKQRDVLRRRIEFCREKDAIGNATMLVEDSSFVYKEFTAMEIRAATDGFSERLRLKSGGDWTDVYKARLNHTSVAIKLYSSTDSADTFLAKVNLFSQMRHPHILPIIGFCFELRCIVFEYMHNGCLRDILFSGNRSSQRRNKGLNWLARINIVTDVFTGLCFLHRAKPRPVAHGNLNPSKILLDRNNVAKIHGCRTPLSSDKSDLRSDIWAYGNLVLQILTGRNWSGLVEEAIMMDQSKLIEVLDPMAGEWPLDIALELGRIGIKCLSIHEDNELNMTSLAREIEKVKRLADELVANGESVLGLVANENEDSGEFPNFSICPIFQDVMKNPHIAADGFSYELEAIEEWLRIGRDTSPMTNLRLKHNLLTPNHNLRSLVQDLQKKKSIR